MEPKSQSGFYVSRKVVSLLALLLLALLLAVVVLAILYAGARLPGIKEVPPTVGQPPSPAPQPTPTGRSGVWNHSRLPSSLMPSHYQVEVWPRLEPGEGGVYLFSGQVNVTLRCRLETRVVLIHSKELKYSGVGISPRGAPAVQDTWVEAVNEFLVIELESDLQPGQDYTLQLNYSGQLVEEPTGLYISHYLDQGINKILAVTQMEPTHARSVFPCFDEPHMKATFDIRLVHRSEFVALSNMPAIAVSEKLEDDGIWNVTTFNTTVKMSTYIVALAICDYDFIGTTYGDTEIRIWAKKESILNGEAQHALNITGPLLQFFETYYNISYPLPKADLIALPEFEASAMENWGLLMFKNDSLLCDPKEKTSENKNAITLMISHELAHQWFGNLVTMKWWNDLWLNEGISSYFEHLVLILFIALFFASLDRLYQVFPFVLQTYLKTFSYSNVVSNDLWHHLQMAVDSQNVVKLPAPIKNILDTWIVQSGFPIVTVNTSTGSLRQEQYIDQSDGNSTWFIPIFWMKNGSMQPMLWLDTENEIFPELKTTTDEEWIILNVNQVCFCRVNYDNTNWNRIHQQLQKDHLVSYNFQVTCKNIAIIIIILAFDIILYHIFETSQSDCISLATIIYTQWMSNPENNSIPEYIRETVYCTAIKVGTEKHWNFAWAMYDNTSFVDDTYRLLYAMTCSREPWILKRYCTSPFTIPPLSHSKFSWFTAPKTPGSFLSDISILLSSLSLCSERLLIMGDFNLHLNSPCTTSSDFTALLSTTTTKTKLHLNSAFHVGRMSQGAEQCTAFRPELGLGERREERGRRVTDGIVEEEDFEAGLEGG
uniref:Aminopeptidase n=1 Tax=Callorhinchus milii TaxID=7868 RepID=A0A4W3JRS9_CALMI